MRAFAATPSVLEEGAVHACWNSIGVRGDKSCPELARHAHCRNCPAYAAAAATLLDRDQHGAVDDDWKRDFAAEAPAEQRKTRSAILARLGKEWFALPILLLDQVTEHRPIHSLPHRRSPAMLGMVNVRGQMLICLSLAQILGLVDDGGAAGDGRRRMIVMRCPGGRVVMPVDEVQQHHRFHDGEVLAAPATMRKTQAGYTLGLLRTAQGMAALMDGDRLAEAVEQSLA